MEYESIVTVERKLYKSNICKEGIRTVIIRFNNTALNKLSIKKGNYLVVSNNSPLTIQIIRSKKNFLGNRLLTSSGGILVVFPSLYPNKKILTGEYDIIIVDDCVKPVEFILTLKKNTDGNI